MTAVSGGTEAMYGKGVAKFLGSLVFPVALMMVVTTGAELFTGNTMVFAVGLADRKVTILALARSWAVTWLLNFFGSIAAAFLLGYLTEMYASEPWLGYLRALTVAKVTRGWGAQVLRGVAANILVCMATLVSVASEDIASKLFACLFFIGTFVLIGFEHSVANMSILSLGLMYGANTSINDVMVNNIIPVTLGNIIGGVFFGLAQWYSYAFAFPGKPVQGITAFHSVASRLVMGETNSTPSKDPIATIWESTSVPLKHIAISK